PPAPAPAPAPAYGAPAQAPTGQSGPELATTDISGSLSTKVPGGVSANGSNSLLPTAKDAADVLNAAKPMHGNLWL
ncbi:hypothetical protein G5C60_29850, partial [Streptomyces sp. HC44]|nr:hypothetical protein [Streptomyces scabichelini]